MGNRRGIGSEAGGSRAEYQKTPFDFTKKLADMSGVSYGSIKRFEATGQISLLSLTKIAIALDIADDLRSIFTQIPYRTIEEGHQ